MIVASPDYARWLEPVVAVLLMLVYPAVAAWVLWRVVRGVPDAD